MFAAADQPILGEEAGSYWAPSADIVVTLSPTNSSSIDRRCARPHVSMEHGPAKCLLR